MNYIFPSYIVDRLRGGLAGLIIAVIFAAAMSALAGRAQLARHRDDGGLLLSASCARTASDARTTSSSRGCSRRSGALFAGVVALQAGQLGSAIEVVNRFGSYFYGSILGVFGLAVLTPRATARGAFYGLFAGMAAVFARLVAHHASPSSGTTWSAR